MNILSSLDSSFMHYVQGCQSACLIKEEDSNVILTRYHARNSHWFFKDASDAAMACYYCQLSV
jgi:hypothetical protein